MDVELSHERALRFACIIPRSNQSDGRFGEFYRPVLFSLCLSPLLHLVAVIVGICPKPEMVRSNASRRVASVTDAHSAGDRPEVENPRNAVREFNPVSEFHASVASRQDSSGPEPASICFDDSPPEIANLASGVVDSGNGFRDYLSSFIHNWTMFEVRARFAVRSAVGLAFYTMEESPCQ